MKGETTYKLIDNFELLAAFGIIPFITTELLTEGVYYVFYEWDMPEYRLN